MLKSPAPAPKKDRRSNTRPIRMTDTERAILDEMHQREMPGVSFNAFAITKLSTPMRTHLPSFGDEETAS
jgi:hypothetical protein